jgi:hypothetical protein
MYSFLFCFVLLSFFILMFCFVLWWDWGLNTTLRTCKAGTLMFELCPFCSGYFGDGVLWTFCLGWPQTIILGFQAWAIGTQSIITRLYWGITKATSLLLKMQTKDQKHQQHMEAYKKCSLEAHPRPDEGHYRQGTQKHIKTWKALV